MSQAVLGVRVKSGWAAAVLLGGSGRVPILLDSCRIELADPKTPGSLQPYHAGTGTAQTDRVAIERLIGLVERCAERSVTALLQRYRAAGRRPGLAAVVGTSSIDPATIGNPHIRIHALEGQLFRRVAREALTRCGVQCTSVLEQELMAKSPGTLGLSKAEAQCKLKGLGEGVAPWRAEQKAAALAAWLLLARS